MRTFVFTDEKSNKFWNIELRGKSYTVTFGRVGTTGRRRSRSSPTRRGRSIDAANARRRGAWPSSLVAL